MLHIYELVGVHIMYMHIMYEWVYSYTCLSTCIHVHMQRGQRGAPEIPLHCSASYYPVIIPLNVEFFVATKIADWEAPETLPSPKSKHWS